MPETYKTFAQFAIEEQRRLGTDENLTLLLLDIVAACKAIASELKNGALADVLGQLDSENVQGETQKKLDVLANETFLRRCEFGGHLAAMVSEEMDSIHRIPDEYPSGRYVLLFDPLDGSSNIDVNVSVGSIFSILRIPDDQTEVTTSTVLQRGVEQVGAGYALYGPSTMLVLTIGDGVNGFTLDGNIGEFRLTHPKIQLPTETSEFAINASRAPFWQQPIKCYVDECLAGPGGPRGRQFNMRWVGSMVAEVHRIVLRGGIFLYPLDEMMKQSGGRLRLLYEANPMSLIVEQAGGLSSTGQQRILEVVPTSLHQRVPVILGSRIEVQHVVDLYDEKHDGP